MSTYEKEPYQKKYEEWKQESKNQVKINAFPSAGSFNIKSESPFDYTESDNDGVKNLHDSIMMFLSTLYPKELSKASKAEKNVEFIKNQRWYFIKFQSFCKSEMNPMHEYDYSPYYVLAELGLVEFSLQEGITNQYHTFIQPNKIPVGYRSQCMDSSRDVHHIPMDNFDEHYKPYSVIYSDILKFIEKKKENNNFTPLFCLNKDIVETKFGLKFLSDCSSKKCERVDKIYDLESLVIFFGSLRNCDISNASAHELLTSFSYDYASNTRCAFHEEDGSVYCSLGYVKRFAYLISDHICQLYDIQVTDKHLPVEKPVGTVMCNLDFSSKSSYNKTNRSEQYNSSHSLNRNRNENFYQGGQSPVKRNRFYEDSFNDYRYSQYANADNDDNESNAETDEHFVHSKQMSASRNSLLSSNKHEFSSTKFSEVSKLNNYSAASTVSTTDTRMHQQQRTKVAEKLFRTNTDQASYMSTTSRTSQFTSELIDESASKRFNRSNMDDLSTTLNTNAYNVSTIEYESSLLDNNNNNNSNKNHTKITNRYNQTINDESNGDEYEDDEGWTTVKAGTAINDDDASMRSDLASSVISNVKSLDESQASSGTRSLGRGRGYHLKKKY
jgi:hypothetical protein